MRTVLGDQATVFRGGFGVFYGAIIGDTALQQLTAPGYQGTNAYFEEVGGTLANPFAPDPFPNYGTPDLLQPTIPNPFLFSSLVVGVPTVTRSLTPAAPGPQAQLSRAIDPFIRTPYTYQYNLTVERSFMKNYVASLSYVGNRGRKLYALEQLNPAFGTTFLAYPSSIPAAQRFTPSTAGTNINARRANTDFALGISQAVAAGNSWYNSMQANLSRRYSNGLLFQVAYTWSKSITDTAGTDTVRGMLDLFDRGAGRGLSSDDVPHRFVGSFLYDLPFGKSAGFAKTVLGGWSVGGIYSLESGRPFSVLNGSNTTGTGGGVAGPFADLGPEPFRTLDPRTNNLLAFNPGAFRNATVTACGGVAVCARRGTSGVNQFRLNNGINNFDFILSKKTRLWSESTSLEIRFEAFNFLNHTQFGPIDTSTAQGGLVPTGVNLNITTAGTPPADFAKFTSARESRVIQLGARFSF
jgi:hypothetical protein